MPLEVDILPIPNDDAETIEMADLLERRSRAILNPRGHPWIRTDGVDLGTALLDACLVSAGTIAERMRNLPDDKATKADRALPWQNQRL